MSLYFFDIHGGQHHTQDDTGFACATADAVRRHAIAVLGDIARYEIEADGEHQIYSVESRDETGTMVYAATISFAGRWGTKPS